MRLNSYSIIAFLWILCIGLFIGSLNNTNALVLQKVMIAAKQKQANLRKKPTSIKLLPNPEPSASISAAPHVFSP